MMRDKHNNLKAANGTHAVAIGTSGTGKTTAAVDLNGYSGVEFFIDYGAVTSTTAVFTVLMTEADATNASFTSVADQDLLGTETDAGLGAGTRTDGSTKNVTKKVGYKGNKRYVKVKVSSLGTAGTPIAILPILHSPRHFPVS
jgi:hypothetical protein